MESSCGNDFYDAGIRIREILLRSTDEKIAEKTLQALIRDFLPQQEEIMEALINIASKTEFSELIKIKDKQVADRQASIFTKSLSKVYSGETVIAAENLIRGLLALEYQKSTNSTKESCPNPDTSMLVAQTKVLQDKISADIRKCEIDTNQKGITTTTISKLKSRTVAIVCLTGTFIWLGVLTTYLVTWSNISTQTQSSSTDSSKNVQHLFKQKQTLLPRN
jgi:hypothetical protein